MPVDEEVKAQIRNTFMSALKNAHTAEEVSAAFLNYHDALARAGINDATTQGLTELMKLPAETLKSLVTTLVSVGQSKVTKMQDLDQEQARMIMNTMAGPDKMRMQVVNIASFISMIFRYFGNTELANEIDCMSRQFSQGVEERLARTLSKTRPITSGADVVQDTLGEYLRLVGTAQAEQQILNSGQRAASASGRRPSQTSPTNPYTTPPPSPLTTPAPAPSGNANTPLTWAVFRANLAAIGVNLSSAVLAKTEKEFFEAAKAFGESDPAKASLNQREVGILGLGLDEIAELTPTQKEKMLDYARAHALQGPQ